MVPRKTWKSENFGRISRTRNSPPLILATVLFRDFEVHIFRDTNNIGSLSMRVFKTRTATGREHFVC